MAEAAKRVGAFPLTPQSKDAALLTTLAPGVYTVQVTGASGTTGVAMVELYDVPVPDPVTRWTMVNVSPNGQQADCHVIEFPDGRVALIDIADAADAGGAALAYLRARKIETIDLVVLSHFHRDHYGRLSDVIDAGITVSRVAFNLPPPTATSVNAEAPWGFSRPEAEWLLGKLAHHGIAIFTPRAGERLIEVPLRDGSFAALEAVCLYDGVSSPIGLTDTNDTSIIVRLVHGKTRALFTGDLNAGLGTWLATSSFDLSADLLKVPHHGTEGCAPDSFFDRVNATVALVPSPAGLWTSPRSARIHDYFTRRGTRLYVSGLDGHVTVTMNSQGYAVERE
jgi:competence protein ComEC